jgi:hypothetical protein
MHRGDINGWQFPIHPALTELKPIQCRFGKVGQQRNIF